MIGTPINLRRAFSKPITPVPAQEPKHLPIPAGENVVIMQPATLIPLPVTTDILGLQTAIGNLQIATYLMQQHLKPTTAASTDDFSKTTGGAYTQRTDTSIYTEDGYQPDKAEDIEKATQTINDFVDKNMEMQKSSTRETMEKSVEFADSQEDLNKMALIPLNKRIKQTVSESSEESKDTQDIQDSKLSQDVETQTELPLNCDLCLFHDNFYKVLLKREVSTTTTTHTAKTKTKPAKEADKDRSIKIAE